jgi:hypothetical protein
MLKLKRFSEGVWFDYPEGGKFKIRPLLPKDFLELREQTRHKIAIKNIHGTQDIVDDYDESKLNLLLFRYMIEDWKEIEAEGNPDEIRDSMFNNTRLRDWISDRSRELGSKISDSFEEESKNSASSQSG